MVARVFVPLSFLPLLPGNDPWLVTQTPALSWLRHVTGVILYGNNEVVSSIPCCGFGDGTKRKCATWRPFLSKGFQRSPPSMHFALKGSTGFTEYFEAVDMTNIHLLHFDISATPAAVKRGKSTRMWSTANVLSTRTRSSEIFFNPKHERLAFWINGSAYNIMQGRATNLWMEMAIIRPVSKKHGDNV